MSDRFFRDFKCEVRAKEEDEKRVITGQPIVYGDTMMSAVCMERPLMREPLTAQT